MAITTHGRAGDSSRAVTARSVALALACAVVGALLTALVLLGRGESVSPAVRLASAGDSAQRLQTSVLAVRSAGAAEPAEPNLPPTPPPSLTARATLPNSGEDPWAPRSLDAADHGASVPMDVVIAAPERKAPQAPPVIQRPPLAVHRRDHRPARDAAESEAMAAEAVPVADVPATEPAPAATADSEGDRGVQDAEVATEPPRPKSRRRRQAERALRSTNLHLVTAPPMQPAVES
eukprot:CAMPEP_0174834846 /NCGR_PEP_ID=MMETSP1114-20130205/5078_1 /TAXON_ID=312471 /ORGANISM="Neobodo designis, Strain CCAP 1951/1" /LENGTH=234 /DNA_ID=CAMNT_0016068775 /DNA_START=27 /DNA_END=728 /DNA_ORIENTATION=+